MSSVGTASPDSVPRDYNYLLGLRPSVRFRLMNQMGAFPNQSDKIAYSSAPPEQQAQALLAALGQMDAQGGGVPAAAQAPATPMQQPMAPPAQAPAQAPAPQMPTLPQQAQYAAQPAAPAFTAPAGGPPAAPAAPAMPTGMRMPGAPGMAAPAAPAAAPAAPAAPRQQVSMPQAPPPAAPIQDGRDPSFAPDDDPLATIIQNQQHIRSSLQSIATSMAHLVGAIDQLKNQAASSTQIEGVTLLTLATFMEAAMQRPRDQIAQELQAAIAGGELQQFLQQALGGPQG
jgi:hypothetical protein